MTLHKAENVNVQNKVVLTQAQFDTVKGYLESYSKENLVINVATQEFSAHNELYQIPFDSLMVALYRPEDITIGQTVEEKLLNQYEAWGRDERNFPEQQPRYYALRTGFKDPLDIIGMKVKGINA